MLKTAPEYWYLRGKDWSEDCVSFCKSGTDLYIACPSRGVSIELDVHAGYFGLRSVESGFRTIVNEAKRLVAKFHLGALENGRILKDVKGKLIYPKPLLIFDNEVRELSDKEKIAIEPLLNQ